MKNGGWLSKYNSPEAQNGIEGTMAGLTDQGFNYNGAWGGTMQMGGSLPQAQDGMLDRIYSKWPALKKLGNVTIKPDESFTKDKTGVGDIEFFSPNLPQVNYDNGYIAPHPGPGTYGVIYNPLTNNDQNIRLDMLHGMPDADKQYKRLRNSFERSVKHSDINDAMKHWYNVDKEKGQTRDGKKQWIDNYVDGQLRTLLFEGDRASQNYSDEEANELLANPKIKTKFDKLNTYLKKGEFGSSVPGSVGFTYARTQDAAPSNGPYAKKTKASAQNGNNIEQDSNEWLTNWYKNRKIPNEQLQSIYEADKPYYLDRLQNIPEVTNVELIDNDPNVTGQYQNNTNKLLMTPNAGDDVYLHELNHYANNFSSTMRSIHDNITEANVAPKEGVKGIYNEKYNYFSDPVEVHSRIQVLRKEAGFKPDEKVTPEILNKFIKNYKGDNSNINDLFNIADPSHLLEMLNYMAANKSNKNLSTAQNGQEMKFYQEGLDWKPKNISKDGSVIEDKKNKPIKEKVDYRKDNIYYGPTEFKECYGEGCSKQATKKVASLYGVDYDELNPQDAWYKKAAVIKGGGKTIYDKSQGSLADSYENLKIGDFVSLDREGSPHAKDESRISGYDISDNEKTEHLGYVVGFNKEGVPLIRHGHEGNVLSNAKSYVQPITEMSLPDLDLNYKVSSIYRPKKLLKDATLKTNKYYKEILPVENLEFFDKENVTKEKKKYLKAFNKNSKEFQLESGLSPEEVSAIGNISYGIFGNESSFNSNIKNRTIETPLGDFDIPIPTKNMLRVPKQMGKELLYNLGITDSSPSLGPTQLKYTDVKFNKDDTITDTGKLMDTLGTTKGGMSNYTTTNYDAVTKGTFANLANKYKQLKSDPKFEFNPENNTVFGNVPIGYALARAWQNPSLSKLKETLQSDDSDYSKAVYKNMSELEGNVFPVNLPEVIVAPNKQKNGGWLSKYEDGGIIEDDRGQWEYPGEITKINSNQITMQGVDYPVLGISDTGDTQMMQPGQDYTYEGESVTEVPMMQGGGTASLRSLMNNDDLKSKSDATKVAKALAPNKVVGSPTRDQGTISVPYEKSIREKAISNLKQYDDPVRGLVTAPAVSALNLLRPDRYFENVNSESDIKDALLNVGLDAAMVAPFAAEFSPYINNTLKNTYKLFPEETFQGYSKLKNSISDYLQGFDSGLADIVKGRPVFETFPITSKQKAKMLSRQDEEFNKGIKFAEDWNYENFKMRPEVEKRIIDIDDNRRFFPTDNSFLNSTNMGYFSKTNPIYNTKNILTSSRKGDIEKMVSKNEITKNTANYIKENRGRISGVNSFPESITLRNHGAYAVAPEHIGDVATHELGHSMQHLGNEFSRGWGNATTEFDSDLYKYYSANPNTKIGSEFKQAMVSPKKGKYVWEASPNELHSELMVARKNLYNNWTTSMLKRGDDPKDAMELLQNPSDEVIDYMINSQNLNRFFKNKTSQEEKRRLIKLLPAAIPVTGTAVALQQKEKNGGWLSKYN
jgi:hypothetical protein